ncbi:hypothetical protein [uncultured Desulfovibrio sp.]|nr:hypothetical protein [uncultured Desulfovibrio sp.]
MAFLEAISLPHAPANVKGGGPAGGGQKKSPAGAGPRDREGRG